MTQEHKNIRLKTLTETRDKRKSQVCKCYTLKIDEKHLNITQKQWHSGIFGKQVQNSALGAIKSKLKNLESTLVINRKEPTTKLCPECGQLNILTLADRTYNCSCGYSQDRDIHSAKNILIIGQKYKTNSLMEYKSTTSEDQTSGFSKSNQENLSHDSMKMEDTTL